MHVNKYSITSDKVKEFLSSGIGSYLCVCVSRIIQKLSMDLEQISWYNVTNTGQHNGS